MTATKNFDKTLNELGELYEFNREIQQFSFCEIQQETSKSDRVSEDIMNYKVRNTPQ